MRAQRPASAIATALGTRGFGTMLAKRYAPPPEALMDLRSHRGWYDLPTGAGGLIYADDPAGPARAPAECGDGVGSAGRPAYLRVGFASADDRLHDDLVVACYFAWRCFVNGPGPAAPPISPGDECPVCLEPFRRPLAAPCGHAMCFVCAVRWRARSCPVCRSPIPPRAIRPAADAHERLAREDPRYVARLEEDAGPAGDLGGLPVEFRTLYADPRWMHAPAPAPPRRAPRPPVRAALVL